MKSLISQLGKLPTKILPCKYKSITNEHKLVIISFVFALTGIIAILAHALQMMYYISGYEDIPIRTCNAVMIFCAYLLLICGSEIIAVIINSIQGRQQENFGLFTQTLLYICPASALILGCENSSEFLQASTIAIAVMLILLAAVKLMLKLHPIDE